jgi:hypothetical protein
LVVKSTGRPVFQKLGRLGEAVEIVPFRFQMADRAFGLAGERDPILVIELEGEEIFEAAAHIPVSELGAVEKHDAGGDIILPAIVSRPGLGQNGFAPHVT